MTLADIARLLALDAGPRRVLVVEDAPVHHEAVVRWLRSEGHTVTAFADVRELDGTLLSGRDLYGEPASVDVATLDAAFLDFYFPAPPWDGARLAREIVRLNAQARVFGMSSVAGANERMEREGALGSLLKRRFEALL